MFNFNENVFNVSGDLVPEGTEVIFVADMFASEYVGGAELTSQALIDSSPFKTHCVKSRAVSIEMIRRHADKFWIFGNFAELKHDLLGFIATNLKYSVLEYDYKYCRYRSPEKHLADVNRVCDCHTQPHGQTIAAFYRNARISWWMSEKQLDRYLTLFPALLDSKQVVLSSVFSTETLDVIKELRQRHVPVTKDPRWIVLGSPSWVKGHPAAVAWCQANSKPFETVWDVPHLELLKRLVRAPGFVYLPAGSDTCPRMVIEAKLLGTQLVLNENVQHKDEEWFATGDVEAIDKHLRRSPAIFWNGIKDAIDHRHTVSGYSTTYDCVRQSYPFERCIQSMLQFCDEVCVVDGGSTDGTLERLIAMAYPSIEPDVLQELAFTIQSSQDDFEFPKVLGDSNNGVHRSDQLRVKVVKRDWSHPRHAVFDGMQKAQARAMCTKEFCWQMDSDEVVHEDDCKKVTDLCRLLPREVDLMALPVIEYWGGADKVRMDVTPWKWRLSRNAPNITHGIPISLRLYDDDGQLYAAQGTDGCDIIDASTGQPIQFVSFYTQEADQLRRAGLAGIEPARHAYESWFNSVVSGIPSVFHYSWFDLVRKIKLYRDYWQNHWLGLYAKDTSDIAENNMFFDVPWSAVTDQMIAERAQALSQIGGWIWHRKWNGERTPWIKCNRSQPQTMLK